MIDEEATFKKFGYYSTDLMPKSGKKIVAVCDDCGKVRVITKQGYHALCRSCARKGERHCNLGKRGKNTPNWKGGLAKWICEECGIEFPAQSSEIKQGRRRFCSRKCRGEWESKHRRGENSPRFGKHPSEETRKKMSDAQKGEKHYNWQGGISFEPYCEKFNGEFKEYIRRKFGRVCFLCGKTEEENGRRLSVHHLNGNKNCGCDGDKTCQFVPLCVSCHRKVHSKKVDWEKKIKDKMRNKLNGWYI